jgi:hypothetical protein
MEDALHADPIQVATAGDLAKLLATLPHDTPVRVTEHVRADPRLDPANGDEETVAAVTAVPLSGPGGAEFDGQAGRGVVIGQRVELGAYVVPRGARVPADTVAFRPYERVIEAMWNGDGAGMLDGCRELVGDVAGWLAKSDVTLLELADDDPDLQDQLEREADWLTAARDRLGLLQSRFVALRERQDEGD